MEVLTAEVTQEKDEMIKNNGNLIKLFETMSKKMTYLPNFFSKNE